MTKTPETTDLRAWMRAATEIELVTLAVAAGTTRRYLYHLASGKRRASAELAGRLEDAAAIITRASKRRLPKLSRTALCTACATCPYATKCKK